MASLIEKSFPMAGLQGGGPKPNPTVFLFYPSEVAFFSSFCFGCGKKMATLFYPRLRNEDEKQHLASLRITPNRKEETGSVKDF